MEKKMNKKGFTLTELIVTIALIGIISIIVFPQISKLKEDNKNEKYKTYEKAMETAAKLYVDSNKNDLWENNTSGTKQITFDMLNGSNLIEPYESDNINCNGSYVCVAKQKNTISYETVVICENNGKQVYMTKGYDEINCS